MKQTGTLLLTGVALMSIICSAAATDTAAIEQEDCDPGLEFLKIDVTDITVSWKRKCFNEDTSYKIELVADKECNKNDLFCDEDQCQITREDLDCSQGLPLKPCSLAMFTVTGNENNDYNETRNTTAAPANNGDWNLKAEIEDSKSNLIVTWGPLGESDFTNCAIKAKVSATCNGDNPEPIFVDTDPARITTATLDITSCIGGNVIATVTYVSDDVPTETTETSEPCIYTPDTTTAATTTTTSAPTTTATGSRNVYPQNVVVYYGIAILFGILQFNY